MAIVKVSSHNVLLPSILRVTASGSVKTIKVKK
jgi:hypothetical protein